MLTRSDCGVWMVGQHESAARAIAVQVMRSLGMSQDDWRTRDRIIVAIADRLDAMLDEVAAHKSTGVNATSGT